ncbi:preprotein translocase subunit SecE [Candidatus Coxiella mudrowiae]|uniref:preprotein translocase subunit SecE n=1 Tax=Candidatus Coxiella mudrowiae TaxID=2054173 RepID=UPI001C12A40F|nr:preprotein translocase subunit SecE [Candidatus Coxiella mudrowiae]
MAQQNAVQDTKSRFDSLKWLLIILLLAGGIVANFYYSHVAVAIRAAIGIVLAIWVLVIASQTQKGQKAWGFMKGSRTELRKVVWPTRQETLQTTLVVVVMVIVTALILWALDSFFMWAVAWMTGERG